MTKVTFEEVAFVIADTLAVERDKITPSSHLVDDLKADLLDLDMAALVMTFEDLLNIEIPDDDVDKIRTVQDAIDYLNKRLA